MNDKEYSKNFAFFSFMSMNNKDVKNLKIMKLLGSKTNNKYIVSEIDNLIYDKEFYNTSKNGVYEKIGKTIRNYNELISLHLMEFIIL